MKKTLEQVKEDLITIHPNLTILSNEYKGLRSKMLFSCSICGHEWIHTLDLVKRTKGCPKCSMKLLSDKFSFCEKNDSIGYKKPESVKYFKDTCMAYKLKPNSNKSVEMVCPDCGTEKKMIVGNFYRRGFSCSICGDGVSLPEKFFSNLLAISEIEYMPQKRFKWNSERYYDFYIPSLNTIIELHGGQHYYKSFKGMELKNIKSNDLQKKQIAYLNGIEKYIEIDCRDSNYNFLKANFENAMRDIFIFDENIFRKAWELSQNSLVVRAWQLWEECPELGQTKVIAKRLNINASTVLRYLKRGVDINMCSYDSSIQQKKISLLANKKRKRKVAQLEKESGKILKTFESISEASNSIIGLPHPTNIAAVCKGRRKSAYGYSWKYLD